MNYRLYGYEVSSEIVLPAPQTAGDATNAADYDDRLKVLLAGSRTVPCEPGRGDVIAAANDADHRGFSLTRLGGDAFLLRFYGFCEFEISSDLSSICAYRDPSCDQRWLEAFLASNVFGHLLALAGKPYLHASAVSFHEGVIAFVGSSGTGKSTLAALLCGVGGCLLTDDLLRVKIGRQAVTCCTGSRQLRLKGAAEQLAAQFGQDVIRTVDGRATVQFSCDPPSCQLAAIVSPRPSRNAVGLHLERLAEKQAFLALLQASYIPAWKNPDYPRNYLRKARKIVRLVPVFSAVFPWGLPFSPDVAEGLRNLIADPTPAASRS